MPFLCLGVDFDATFTKFSKDITVCKYFQVNSFDCPTCEKRDFIDQVYFEPLCNFTYIKSKSGFKNYLKKCPCAIYGNRINFVYTDSNICKASMSVTKSNQIRFDA